MLTLLAFLLVGHALADYPLQGDFLARAKNERAPIPGVPWWQAMTSHCVIHAGMVLIITSLWWLAALEFVIHFVTDRLKCRGQISFNTDQAIHVACKVMWAALAWHVAGFAGLTA